MKKLLLAALWLPLMALAQSYPSPTYNNVTVQGTLTGKVNSTGSTITNATITGGTISGLSSPLPVASGGTNSASASGTALDNITGFAGTGFMSRTGAGAYSFTASTGSGSVVLATSPTITTPSIASPTVTGAFTATGLVTTADLATQAANTVLSNVTGSTASPTAYAMPSCSTATGALNYTTSTGFTCNGTVVVNYTASGASPQTRTTTQRFADDVHMEDYCSASLLSSGGDVTSCLQNAINSLPSAGGRCITLPATPSGVTWNISSTINIGNGSGGAASTTNSICLRGAGSGGLYGSYGTTLTWNGTGGGTMVSVNGPINNYELSNVNLNGNNSAGTVLLQNSVRFSDLHNLYISGFTGKGIDTEGLSTTGDLNFMLDWSKLYVTTNQSNAIAVNFDGVITNSTDTWLSTVRNSRFESLGAGGIAMRLGFSDNMMFDQLHLVTGTSGGKVVTLTGNISNGSNQILSASTTTGIQVGEYITDNGSIGADIPAGTKITNIAGTTITLSKNATATANGYGLQVYATCGLLLDSSSTVSGNPFPTGHQFNKTATDNVCFTYDSTHPMGVNTVYGFGTSDLESVPNNPYYIGITDTGTAFGGFGGPTVVAYTPSYTQNGGTQGSGNTTTGHYALQAPYADVNMTVSIGASGVTAAGNSISVGLPPGLVAPTYNAACSGVNATTGTALTVLLTGGATTATVWTYSGAFPVANNQNIAIECRYIY